MKSIYSHQTTSDLTDIFIWWFTTLYWYTKNPVIELPQCLLLDADSLDCWHQMVTLQTSSSLLNVRACIILYTYQCFDTINTTTFHTMQSKAFASLNKRNRSRRTWTSYEKLPLTWKCGFTHCGVSFALYMRALPGNLCSPLYQNADTPNYVACFCFSPVIPILPHHTTHRCVRQVRRETLWDREALMQQKLNNRAFLWSMKADTDASSNLQQGMNWKMKQLQKQFTQLYTGTRWCIVSPFCIPLHLCFWHHL